MTYKQAYETWLNSPALSEEEKDELRAIAGNERRLRAAFSAPWSSAPPGCGAPCAWGCTR